MNRAAIMTAIASVKQAYCEEPLTYKLDRREIDDLADAILGIMPRKPEPTRADYDIDDAGVMRATPEWERDERGTYLRLMLVSGHDVTEQEVAAWTDDQCKEADCWSFSTHLSASDNDDIQVPSRPAFIAHADRNLTRHLITGEPIEPRSVG